MWILGEPVHSSVIKSHFVLSGFSSEHAPRAHGMWDLTIPGNVNRFSLWQTSHRYCLIVYNFPLQGMFWTPGCWFSGSLLLPHFLLDLWALIKFYSLRNCDVRWWLLSFVMRWKYNSGDCARWRKARAWRLEEIISVWIHRVHIVRISQWADGAILWKLCKSLVTDGCKLLEYDRLTVWRVEWDKWLMMSNSVTYGMTSE